MKKKRISLIAVNDNTAPKLRQTNSALGWVFLVILLMAGIFFAFSSESAEDGWEVLSGPASVKSFSSDTFDEEAPPAPKPAPAKPKPHAAPKPKPSGGAKFQRTQYNKYGRR